MERYTCLRELVPVIESALAAEGYVVEAPLQKDVSGTHTTVMTRGNAVISLHEDTTHEMADIHVNADGESGGLTVFEQIPRLSCPRR